MKSLFHRAPYPHPVKRPAARTAGTGSKSFYHNELERDIYFALGGNSGNTLRDDAKQLPDDRLAYESDQN